MQDTKEWLEWRHQGIGGSDIPTLFGINEYRNYEQLLMEKVECETVNKRSYITDMGHKWEKIVRTQIFLETMIDYRPGLFVDSEHDYMRVSLDGHDAESKSLIEIKMTGREKFEALKDGSVPKSFLYQVQYQLAVTGYDKGFLCAVLFDKEKENMGERVKVEIRPDAFLIEKILLKVHDVWKIILHLRRENEKYQGND